MNPLENIDFEKLANQLDSLADLGKGYVHDDQVVKLLTAVTGDRAWKEARGLHKILKDIGLEPKLMTFSSFSVVLGNDSLSAFDDGYSFFIKAAKKQAELVDEYIKEYN